MSIRLAPLSLGKRLLRLAQLSNPPSVVRWCFCPPLACHCHCFKCPLQAVGGGSCSWPEEVVEWSRPTVALLCHSFLSSLGKLDLNESYTRVWVSDIVARVTLRSDTVLPFLPSTWPLSSHTTTIPISNAMQGIGKLFLCAIQSILKLWQVFGNMRVPTLDSHYAKCPKISHDMRFDIFTITYFLFIVPFLHFCSSLPCLSSAFQNSPPPLWGWASPHFKQNNFISTAPSSPHCESMLNEAGWGSGKFSVFPLNWKLNCDANLMPGPALPANPASHETRLIMHKTAPPLT